MPPDEQIPVILTFAEWAEVLVALRYTSARANPNVIETLRQAHVSISTQLQKWHAIARRVAASEVEKPETQ